MDQIIPKYKVTVTLFSLGTFRNDRHEISMTCLGRDVAILRAKRILRNGARHTSARNTTIYPPHRIGSVTISEIKP